VIKVSVGQHHHAHLEAALIERAVVAEGLQHQRAEAARRAFLDGDEHFVVGGEFAQQILIERLGETRVGDGC